MCKAIRVNCDSHSCCSAAYPRRRWHAAVAARNAAAAFASSQSALAYGDSFTISGWIHLPTGISSILTIAANSVSGATSSGFRFYVNGINTMDRKLVLETANGTQFANVASAAGAITFDGWQHVAAVINRSSGTATLYCNSLVVANGRIRTDFLNLSVHRALTTPEVFNLMASSNKARQITPPASLSIVAGTSGAALAMAVSDLDDDPATLTLAASFSNSALPHYLTVFSAVVERRGVTPVAWEGGVTIVTLAVRDGKSPGKFARPGGVNRTISGPTIQPYHRDQGSKQRHTNCDENDRVIFSRSRICFR